MLASEEHFKLFGWGRGFILRPDSQNFSNGTRGVQHQLPRRNGHGAVGVHLRDHVINEQAVGGGTLRGQPLVFCPAGFGQHGGRCRFLFCFTLGAFGFPAFWRLSEFVHHFQESGGRRQLGFSTIRGEHGRENVGGLKSDFGKRLVRGGGFQGQRIFKLVSCFAQFAEAAGRRVAFQRMRDAPDAAHGFHISGLAFQFQRFVVQRLKQLLGRLEEEFAQLRVPLVGGMAHPATSTCWYAVPLLRCTMTNFLVSPSKLSAWPTSRYPPGLMQRQNFSTSRFCSASSKYIMTLRQKITSLRCGKNSVFKLWKSKWTSSRRDFLMAYRSPTLSK